MATGNVAQVTDKETKPRKKATKAKAEKVETAAAPEAAPETNGEQQAVRGPEAPEATSPAPTGIQDQIYKDREDLTEKMLSGKVEVSGKVEESKLAPAPQFIDAPIFPDAYCPKCGQKLSGNSKTGFKQSFYTHPFTPAIALGKPCELKGKKLRAPVARMEIID